MAPLTTDLDLAAHLRRCGTLQRCDMSGETLRQAADEIERLEREVSRLNLRCAELMVRAEKYAQHLPGCPTIASTDGPNAPYPCRCGFEPDVPAKHVCSFSHTGGIEQSTCVLCGALNRRTRDLGEKINQYVTKEVTAQYKEIVDGMSLYPESKEALWVHVFSCDEVVKRFDLEAALLEWFDVSADEQTASQAQMQAWAAGLERVADRIRTAVAEGRFAVPE